jgi:hypothetical protein
LRHDPASASGWAIDSAQSLQSPGAPLQQWRMTADADGNASGAFFELTLRAGRIAPRI